MSRALAGYLPLLLLLIWAAVIDLRQRRIPNWLTLLLISSGITQSLFAFRTVSPAMAVLGIFAGAALPFILFAIGAMGGGDVKLMAGVGAWLGPIGALAVFALEKVLGLLIVVTQAAFQGRTRVLLRNSAVVAVNLLYVKHIGIEHASRTGKSCRSLDRPLPFAVPVLMAVVLVVLHGWRRG